MALIRLQQHEKVLRHGSAPIVFIRELVDWRLGVMNVDALGAIIIKVRKVTNERNRRRNQSRKVCRVQHGSQPMHPLFAVG